MKKAVKKISPLDLTQNPSELKFEVILRPTYSPNGKLLNWGVGRVRSEDSEQIRHLNEFFPGINRDVNSKHIEKLSQSILEHGFIGGVVVGIIKGHMFGGDANNRLYALRQLKRDIIIIYAEFDTIEAFMKPVITTNNSGRNWGTGQYIETYNVLDREPYKVLKELQKEYGFNKTILVGLLGGLDINAAKNALKDGSFKLIERKRKGYETRVSVAWRFANKFIANLFSGDEPMKASNQRIGEAIIVLMGHIQSTALFNDICDELAIECNRLYKNERTTKQFAKLFIEGYRNITEKG